MVERLAGPRHERRRDAEERAVRVLEDERRRGRVPGRVAARLEGRADAAGRERRGVGLALDQLLAGELGDRGAVAGRAEERVVLLGRHVRSAAGTSACSASRPSPSPSPSSPRRPESASEVSSASPVGQRRLQALEDVLRQALALLGEAEDVLAEDRRRRAAVRSVVPSAAPLALHCAAETFGWRVRVMGKADCLLADDGRREPENARGTRLIRCPKRHRSCASGRAAHGGKLLATPTACQRRARSECRHTGQRRAFCSGLAALSTACASAR